MSGMKLEMRLLQTGGAIALLVLLTMLALPIRAQQANPGAPIDPDASVVKEQTLLQEAPRIEGRIDIPDRKASVLIQPAGRRWDHFHEVTLRWLGVVVILGMLALLACGYLLLGRIRITAGRSGEKVKRFSAFERFSHWLTAVSFVLLALIRPESFSAFSQAAKYVHNFVSFAFVAGLCLIVVLWIKDNIPDRSDLDWLKQGGGFIKSKHAAARRFNAGEKLVFWFALGAGVAVIVSGYLLLFPFYLTNIAGMQLAQVVHAVVAMLFVAVILAHIYIGTLGMEGAFEAMGTGEVDLNWAREHHDLWLEDQLGRDRPVGPSAQPPAVPAK